MTDTTGEDALLLVATAVTHTAADSMVQVTVQDFVCTLATQPNAFNDLLPIIPTASRVENGRILYQLQLKATLVNHANGYLVEGHALEIHSNRTGDTVRVSARSDSRGELTVVLETRTPGDLELRTSTPGVTLSPFQVHLKDAWYQSRFLVTGYNVCAEEDFAGALVEAAGLNETHRNDFLFGAAGVPMQGTGLALNGRYIRLRHFGGGWHVNRRGHRDRANTPSAVSFQYADGVVGAYGAVSANRSIAVDPTVIPRHARVAIDGVGERVADDTGSAIRQYHIDNFLGAGAAVVHAWRQGGINGTQRAVRYIGQ